MAHCILVQADASIFPAIVAAGLSILVIFILSLIFIAYRRSKKLKIKLKKVTGKFNTLELSFIIGY